MRPVLALALATDPISLFCDRLVDALLSDRTVKIQLDAKRSSASLKYLFTELVCNKCGGECLGIAPRDASPRAASLRVPLTIIVTPLRPPPFVWSRLAGPEVLTGNGLEETRLLVSSKELFQLLRCAEAASDHIANQCDPGAHTASTSRPRSCTDLTVWHVCTYQLREALISVFTAQELLKTRRRRRGPIRRSISVSQTDTPSPDRETHNPRRALPLVKSPAHSAQDTHQTRTNYPTEATVSGTPR